ncbi:MAG TPA: hypothetical protein DCS88_11955 [Alphaproteobacteria bacterium]|nr:hypothetical protein [Alphaproteobacteria bacterium]
MQPNKHKVVEIRPKNHVIIMVHGKFKKYRCQNLKNKYTLPWTRRLKKVRMSFFRNHWVGINHVRKNS